MAAAFEHPLFARCYARLSVGMERELGPWRARLVEGLTGEVLELGAGNGMMFGHYPASVTGVLAVEPEPHLRGLAVRAAADAPVPVQVVEGHADALPADDASVDAVVACLVLCSVPDPVSALREVRRVLRPGGELRLLEHVASSSRIGGAVQRALDATVWPRVAGGCHTHRDPVAALAAAGFEAVSVLPFRFPDSVVPAPTRPHLLATARR